MEKQKQAYFYAVPTVLLWASVPVVIKLLVPSLEVLQVVLFTASIAALTMLGVLVWQGKLHLLATYKPKDYAKMFFSGLLGVFLQNLFLFGAIALSTAQEAFIINYVWPILVALFAVPLLKERLTRYKLAGLLFGFAGVYVIATRGALLEFQFTSPLGNLLALATAIVMSLYLVLDKKFNYDSHASLFVYFLSGALFSLPAVLLFSSIPAPSLEQGLLLVWMGVLVYAAAYFTWFKALRMGDTAKVAMLGYLTPVLSLVYIFFFLSEPILPSSVVGLALILAGIFVQRRG